MSTVPARVLLSGRDGIREEYEPHLGPALEAVGAELVHEADPASVDVIVAGANGPVQDYSAFPNCRAVLSLWAGVEPFLANPTLTMPLARMIDPGLTAGMVEYVTGHVLRHHLGMDAHIVNPGKVWDPTPPPLASSRRVGILGVGELGGACARMLVSLGFDVTGWSRSEKDENYPTRHGEDGLRAVLERSDMLVTLLPLTPETTGVLDAETLALMPKGAVIVNTGRGGLIDDYALLAALDEGRIGHATLDVFDVEPLPENHPYWTHPRVTVTPHIASATRAETASQAVAENVRRIMAGEPPVGLVHRDRGY